ncbi:MAG: penicillin-binding protein 2 [Bacteroidia bacterium]|nr:penicillin-binding protein 2 [Bacteroidia bacterium]MCX7652206.1 penicillin-binding protein 2 [Bacteroidia bacterium]MDW8416468.1 penicillin-binding protein 2 [Bacteroidia bacterium]
MSKTLKRFYIFLIGAALLWIGFLIRLGYLQWKYRNISPYDPYTQRPYLKRVVGERGSIFGRDNTVLATSMPFFRVAADPGAWSETEVKDSLKLLAEGLSRLFPDVYPKPENAYRFLHERWKSGDRHVYLLPYKLLLTYAQQKAVAELPLLRHKPGRRALVVEKITHKRSYPYGRLARATLGYLVNDSVAWRGLESAFHEVLSGEERWILVHRLPNGIEIPLEDLTEFEPQAGADVFTTIDPHLQDIVTQALENAIKRHQAKDGVAILMEVTTGEILAIANAGEEFNHAVSTLWEPGSTFKVATAAALLEAQAIQPDQRFLVPASLKVADRTLTDGHAGGSMTFTEALARSSNVAFASLCYKTFGQNPVRFYSYLERFHLLDKSGVSLYSEPKPAYIPPRSKYFNPTTLPWLAIGYNIRLTPLQILAFYNAIANEGRWLPPKLVREIRYPDGQIRVPELPLPQRIMSVQTATTLRRLLRKVVEEGTAQSIANPLYTIAGKTGTAKKVERGTYVNRYRASFVGFFPAERPRYSCIVVIDDPQEGGIYGAEVAAPVFREIADAIVFRDLQVAPRMLDPLPDRLQPTLPVMVQKRVVPLYNVLSISTPDRPETRFVRTQPNTHYVQFLPHKAQLPEAVIGMSLRSALAELESAGYAVYWRGKGPFVVRIERRSNREVLLELGDEAPF